MIGLLTRDDIGEAVSVWRRFYEEYLSGLGVPFDDESAFQTLERIVSDNDRNISVCAKNEGKIVGVLIGFADKAAWNKNVLIATEVAWYVDKKYRGYRYGNKLLTAFEDKAKENGASKIIMAYMNSASFMGPYYNARGYNQIETHYMKGI